MAGQGRTATVEGAAVLDKALGLLTLISRATAPMSFSQLARVSGLPKSTLHRLLSALLAHGVLRLEDKDRTYRLGLRLLELAHNVWGDFDLRSAAEPELSRLRESTGETVQLAVLDGDGVLVVDSAEGRQAIRHATGIGARLPVHAAALGKALVGFLDSAERHDLVARFSPVSSRALLNHLDLVRTQGYAVEDEEQAEGVRGVAVPILDSRGRAIGAVGLSGPAFRLTVAHLHELAPAVMASARRISHNAGGLTVSIDLAPQMPGRQPMEGVACVAPTRTLLGEGPHWAAGENALYWVDMLAPAVYRFDPTTGALKTIPTEELVSVVIPRQAGGFLVAAPGGLGFIDATGGPINPFAHPEAERPGNRYNDGKCDRRGRLWIGTLDPGGQPHRGSLLRIDADGAAVRVETGITIANGLGWSPDDRRLYFTDSGRRAIDVFDFDLAAGTVANRRPFVTWPAGAAKPDGLAVDAEGFVWTALWDGWRVERYDPKGRLDRTIHLPVPRPTSVCFGGPGLKTLYITSARLRLSAETLARAPLSGGLFTVASDVAGLAVMPFAG